MQSAREYRAERRNVLRNVVNIVVFPNRSYLLSYQGRVGVVFDTLFQVEGNLTRLRSLNAEKIRKIILVDIPNPRTVLPALIRFRNAHVRTLYRRRPQDLVLPKYSAEQMAGAKKDCDICYEKMVVEVKPFRCDHVICEPCALRSAHFHLDGCAFCRTTLTPEQQKDSSKDGEETP